MRDTDRSGTDAECGVPADARARWAGWPPRMGVRRSTIDAHAPRRAYSAPVLVALDMKGTQGDVGAYVDGAEGALFTSGGGPQ
jgi:hypothetical protein